VPDEPGVDDPAGDSVADLRDEIEALHRKLEKLEKRGNRSK
jgi:ubiquinone biosynthesis protein UbiJ